ncbi:MAG: DMT family transporter [Rhodospirillales bacterium]|nr:DMT family transporter [Rhodospirillales bacterium]
MEKKLPPVRRLYAVGLMVVSTLMFASMHAIVRHVSSEGLHPFEIAFFRNFFGLLVILPWIARQGLAPLRTKRLGSHALRASFNAIAMLAFFWALSIAPLSQVQALAFGAPVFATVLAAIFLGEKAGPRGWIAIIAGFAGIMVVLRPGIEDVGLGAGLTIFAAMTWAVTLLVIKSLIRTESSVTITAYMSLLIAPIVLVPALFVWQWPDPTQWMWLIATGILGNLGQILMVYALKQAPTHVVMPLDFLKLVWVSIIAFLAFSEIPDLFTWIGGVLIFLGAALIAIGERKRAS